MKREEYLKICELIEKGDLVELQNYVDDTMNNNKLRPQRTAIMKMIKQDSEVEYPSYYQRVNKHQGPKIYYNGVIAKTENGILIFHRNSNIFLINNEKIVDSKLSGIIARNIKYSNTEDRNEVITRLNNFLPKTDEIFTHQVFCLPDASEDSADIELFSEDNSSSIIVPRYFYRLAGDMLVNPTEQYISDKADALYIKSKQGKALIGARTRKK